MEAIRMILRPIIGTFLVIIVMQLILAVLGLLFIAFFPLIETFLVIIVMQLILAVLGLLFFALFPPELMMDTEPLKLEDYQNEKQS